MTTTAAFLIALHWLRKRRLRFALRAAQRATDYPHENFSENVP